MTPQRDTIPVRERHAKAPSSQHRNPAPGERLRLGRRELLRYGLYGAGALALGSLLQACSQNPAPEKRSNIANLGPLGAPDANGVQLPAGFSSRIVARSGETVAGTGFAWHSTPDGGGVMATSDDGWIYLSNSELGGGSGGASALRFDSQARVVAAYSICSGTNRNCAGGVTPWGTWLSCEEVDRGLVWECDPFGQAPPIALTALGVFKHEAAAVDPTSDFIYMTEDVSDGGFYRFRATGATAGRPDLSQGVLEIAEVGTDDRIVWHPVPDPSAATTPTRRQVAAATPFSGGEGIWYGQGRVTFTTKGDNRIWVYDLQSGSLRVRYDAGSFTSPVLTGVDNVTGVPFSEDIVVAEDGGNLELVAVTAQDQLIPIVRLVGHDASEVSGPAFSPDGTRLYFSSQRGTTGSGADGVTFEVTGPFVV